MLYNELLLQAAKNATLVNDKFTFLTDDEVVRYFDYLKNAIAKFNNNIKVSIGTEKLWVNEWYSDWFGFFARIVRDPDLQKLYTSNPAQTAAFPETQGQSETISALQWQPINKMLELPEIPQRIISVNGKDRQSRWILCNTQDFFQATDVENVVCYELSENEGIIRAKRPETLFVLFDRAIPYCFSLQDLKNKLGQTTEPYSLFDLIAIYADVPTTHIPYLINLVALELAQGQKLEQSTIMQLREQVQSQEEDLYKSNVRDRVKTDDILRDYSWNFWHRRAFR